MKLFNPKNSGGADNPSWFMYLIAAPFVPLVQSAKWLTHKVYDTGWEGGLRTFLGVLFGLVGAIAGGHWLGWTLGNSWYCWLPGAVAAWLAVYFYVWPLLYLFPVHPVWRLCDSIYDGVRTFTQKYWEKITAGLLKAVRTVCLGSNRLWNPVLGKDSEGWFVSLLRWLCYVALVGGGLALGWHVFGLVVPALSAATVFVSFPAAIAAGLAAALLVIGLGWQLLDYGKVPFTALLLSAAAIWWGGGFIAAFGFGTLATAALYLAAFVLFAGYVFPLVCLLFSSGFWQRVWKKLEPLCDSTYDEKDENYARFFHHLTNLTVTAAIASLTVTVCHATLLSAVVTVPVVAVIAFLTYIVGFKMVNHDGGNGVTGAAASIIAGIEVGRLYAGSGLAFGAWGATACGALAALACGFIVFPLAYVALRWVCKTVRLSLLGKPLDAAYRYLDGQFGKLLKQLRNAYSESYEDKTNYQKLLLHVINICVAAVVFWALHAFVLAGSGAVLSVAALALATALSYLLVGKVLFSSGYGLEFVGGVAGLFAAAFIGTELYGVHPSFWVIVGAVAGGIASWVATYFIAFPVVYVLLRAVTGWTSPVLVVFTSVYDFCWKGFMKLWMQFVRAYNGLVKLLTPLWNRFVAAFAAVKQAYDRILKALSRS